MSKEELEKEAYEYFKSICDDYNEELERTGKRHYWVGFDIENAYIASAEPREKRIADLEQKLETERSSRIALVNKIAELERKYQELVDKLHHCWNCKKSFDKSCSFGKMLEAEKKKCKDWESTFGISN